MCSSRSRSPCRSRRRKSSRPSWRAAIASSRSDYFRHHPLARYAGNASPPAISAASRYLSGGFYGLKRARADIGVTANDAVHFLDLFSWLMGSAPVEVFAVHRDHFGRGLEDLALVVLTYPDGRLAKLEASYIQPGHQPEQLVMPNALTTKIMEVCGSEGALAIDFQAECLTWHRARHERHADGSWHPVFGNALVPKLEPSGPVDILASQFAEFLDHVAQRTAPEADVQRCGVDMAVSAPTPPAPP